MPNVPLPDLIQAVKKEFEHWKVDPQNPEAIGAIARVARGYLADSQPWPFTVRAVQDQLVAYLVDSYLSHWTPEYPDDGHLPQLVASEFASGGKPDPGADMRNALVRVCVGILRQPSLPRPKAAPVGVARVVVDWFNTGNA